jgi:hypothetical protein
MKKEIFQENKARWELFEQVGSLHVKILWAVIATALALVIVWLLI